MGSFFLTLGVSGSGLWGFRVWHAISGLLILCFSSAVVGFPYDFEVIDIVFRVFLFGGELVYGFGNCNCYPPG